MTAWTLVTGGSTGLGAAICRTLASQGNPVLVHYHQNSEAAHALVGNCRALGVEADCIQADFSSNDSVQVFIGRCQSLFGAIASLVNNVGEFSTGSATVTPVEQWKELFQLNVFAPVAIVQGLLPGITRASGCVVNMGMVGIQHSYADIYCSAYSAAKAALWQLTRSLAKELLASRVRVNMVSPGYLETSVVKPQSFPLGREASIQEVADLVAFLMGPSAHYITGQNIEVAGGVRL